MKNKYMLYVLRDKTTKVVFFVTTTGPVAQTATELISQGATETISGENWGTDSNMELLDLSSTNLFVPEDYYGQSYRLTEGGPEGYTWVSNL